MTYVAIYDRIRLIALASRAAARKGQSPSTQPSSVVQGSEQVMVTCPPTRERKTFTVASALLTDQSGGPVPRAIRGNLTPPAIARLLPGENLPKGSVAAAYQVPRPRENDRVLLSYMENSCGVVKSGRWVPLTFIPPREVEMPSATLPAGMTVNAPMLLQSLIDLEGKIQRPEYTGGQMELLGLANENLASWKVEPVRVNGALSATAVVAQVQFKHVQ